MRLLTFSFLRNCKNKVITYQLPKRLSSDKCQPRVEVEIPADDSSSLVEVDSSWPAEAAAAKAEALRDMRVIPDFVSADEEAELMRELEPVLKRMRYEFDHWDNAIHGFRETERRSWSPTNQVVMSRVLAVAFPPGSDAGQPLPYQHVLDLAMAGEIKPHVDAVRFCGNVIAGISLLSGAVMRLQHTACDRQVLRALLPRRSLYIMKGVSRYAYTHAVLGGGDVSMWRGEQVTRQRRVAVITRSEPSPGRGETAVT